MDGAFFVMGGQDRDPEKKSSEFMCIDLKKAEAEYNDDLLVEEEADPRASPGLGVDACCASPYAHLPLIVTEDSDAEPDNARDHSDNSASSVSDGPEPDEGLAAQELQVLSTSSPE